MDTGVIIAIAIGAIVLIALVVMIGRSKRQERLEGRRDEAHDHREQARVRSARADRAEAEAEERAARAKREQALAEEQAVKARAERGEAQERREYAEHVDPDK
jgi:FtsZ-interacting cell division protein ZipA